MKEVTISDEQAAGDPSLLFSTPLFNMMKKDGWRWSTVIIAEKGAEKKEFPIVWTTENYTDKSEVADGKPGADGVLYIYLFVIPHLKKI